MQLSRRRFLVAAAGGGVAATLGVAGCGNRPTLGELVRSEVPLPDPFRNPLPVPAVAKPTRRDHEADYYEIVQRSGATRIVPGVDTEIWGYGGSFPGPTFVTRRGRRIVVRQRNELPVPVSVHLHGGRTPPEHDGYPTDLVVPANGYRPHPHGSRAGWSFHNVTKDYAYPLDQRAATLWYHDHRMDFTGPQVYRGLFGLHLVTDDEEDALPLPKGDREIPLLIADRAFGEDGSFRYPALDPDLRTEPGVQQAYMEGVMGDVVLVNGAPWPELEVSNTRYRFRILNASNARRYQLALDPPPPDGPAFIQIGSDGGLLSRPRPHTELPIAPAERFDVIVDFSRYPVGTTVTVRNTAGAGSSSRVMRFRVARRERDDSGPLPRRLAEVEPLRPNQATRVREFSFRRGQAHGRRGWTVNGEAFEPTVMAAHPRLGDVEIWRFTSDFQHPVHLHLTHFQVLSRNGREPLPTDLGWKDTVNVDAYGAVEVITRFTGYRGRYVLHCHNLEHEDMAMMANYETV